MKILIVGCPGTGKTWIMKQLIKLYQANTRQKMGKFWWHKGDDVIIVGKYDGSTFEGSDRLSMSIMTDVDRFLLHIDDKITIFEGDRFMNKTFIGKAKPLIIKVDGDGEEGRKNRGSKQTETHLKRMATRVRNVDADYTVNDSGEALSMVTNLINKV